MALSNASTSRSTSASDEQSVGEFEATNGACMSSVLEIKLSSLVRVEVDTVSLLITNMSGDQLLHIDDVAAHVRMHPQLDDVSSFLELHEHKLGGPWPRLELVMLDARESGDDVPEEDNYSACPESVLRENRGFLDEVQRCGELVWADSDVTIGGLVGCLPTGVRLEIRLAVILRTDRYRLEYHTDGLVNGVVAAHGAVIIENERVGAYLTFGPVLEKVGTGTGR